MLRYMLRSLNRRHRSYLSPSFIESVGALHHSPDEVNAWALTLRALGHDVPRGTVLFGVTVTA